MSSRNSHDYEGESFDDAPESIHNEQNLNVSIPTSSSTRSLTDSPVVGSSVSPDNTEKPHLPSESQAEQQVHEENESIQHTLDEPNNHKRESLDQNERSEVEGQNKDEMGAEEFDNSKDEDDKTHLHEKTAASPEPAESDLTEDGHDTPGRNVAQKSPLLTSHRLSSASSLDEVNLTASKEDEPIDIKGTTPEIRSEPPALPPREEENNTLSGGLMGLSGALPPMPWAAPPVNKNPPPVAAPPYHGNQAVPSRGSEARLSPPTGSRRNTASSVSTIASKIDQARSHDGDDGDASSVNSKKPRRNSLKDQFKALRMREDTHWAEHDAANIRPASFGQSGAGPSLIPEEQESVVLEPPISTSAATSPGGATTPSTINPGLAPGTVSGFSRSATDASAPVDWDLWQQLVNNGPQAIASSEELNAAIKRGIPQTIRGVIWQILTDSRATELDDVYRDLVTRGTDKERRPSNGTLNGVLEESASSSRSSIRSEHSGSGTQSTSVAPSPGHEIDPEKLSKEQAAAENVRAKKAKDDAASLQKLEKAIRRDLGARTSYSKYFISQGNQESLFGLCKAYALYDEAVGYAQGMNFIVMPLLFNMDEVEAFELLVKLMNKYGLREMFIADMPGLHRSLYQFERLLEDLEPAIYCHLRRRGVPPQLYATQWFLTLFAYRFPLQLVLRIYDLIFEEGLESTILKFAIAIMRRNAEALLEMKDMSSLTSFLKERLFDAYIDKQPSASSILESGFFGSSGAADKEVYRADILVQDACAATIDAYTVEWEEKTRAEKEREVELETLRHSVATLTARVRLLEERAEASDKEHVQLASELVHVKVENEELRDLNDALKLQTAELKNVVDKQPAEVEEKLRTEMERIMKRNIEVQNENRAMEENMAEMEKELVATKMKWAELSENHDNLKQKWSDLRRALD
ncbi:hypothetical protein N7470_005695 [Penicillium chermesinum]|nr:hypothetical protein N7470_005695 [Penicillium chermesinum]